MKRKKIPVLFNDKSECCGCSACYSICSQNAIHMKRDKEGFLYPYINEERCIICEMCIKVCAFKSN